MNSIEDVPRNENQQPLQQLQELTQYQNDLIQGKE